MKVIDLLNKIANGEQPKAFEHNEELYIWEEKDKWYLSEPLLNLFYIHNNILNDEIEIIEEPKKIKKIDISIFPKHNNSLKKTAIKLNEIIDYINKENK